MFGLVVKSRRIFSKVYVKKQYTNRALCGILEYRLELRVEISRSLSLLYFTGWPVVPFRSNRLFSI